MKFWQEFLLQLISPVVGTALIGGAVALIARRYQDRQLDRQFRMDLVTRVSEIVYAIHTELSFYERWVRHSRPQPKERDERRITVNSNFLTQRTRLGALQTEIDAYFRRMADPGRLIHRLTDLIMLRYALILDLPSSQVNEIVSHLGEPGHSGYSGQELESLLSITKPSDSEMWRPIKEIENSFTNAFRDAIDSILATKPITKVEGFRSQKLLTAYDQHDLTVRATSLISEAEEAAT